MKNSLILALVVVVGIGITPFFIEAQVAEPQFLLTWKAQSYVPPQYSGKVLPSTGSTVTAHATLFEDGRPVDLSNELVVWQLNKKFLTSGNGLTTVTFPTSPFSGMNHELRVRINNFRDRNQLVLKTIDIPGGTPEAIIEAPYPDGRINSTEVRVNAHPYFFSIESPEELSYAWDINGKFPSALEDPEILHIGLPSLTSGEIISIRLTLARDATDGSLETAESFTTLTAQ